MDSDEHITGDSGDRGDGFAEFVCDKCGLCCQHLREFGDLYRDLDDGSGACRHHDRKTGLCRIYDTRPLKCRVEEGYLAFFSSFSRREYIEKTLEGCRHLKAKYGSHEQNEV